MIPRWGDRDIKSIARRDVTELLDSVMDEGSKVKDEDGSAERCRVARSPPTGTLAAIRALFNSALRRGIIDATPVALVERPGEETRRERTLSADEILAVWNAGWQLGYPFGRFFQLALILGQRREEVARMRWADLDLEAANWTLPAEATKAGRSHVVPLAPLAIDILRAMPRKADASGKARQLLGVHHVRRCANQRLQQGEARIDQVIAEVRDGEALAPWTIHDLRRTAATEMARLGVSRFIISKVLNHADRTVTAIYDRHAYLHEKRHALESGRDIWMT